MTKLKPKKSKSHILNHRSKNPQLIDLNICIHAFLLLSLRVLAVMLRIQEVSPRELNEPLTDTTQPDYR